MSSSKFIPNAQEVLQALFQNSKSPLASGYKRVCLERDWKEVVGRSIAENSRPVSLDRRTLLVEVRHSVWGQELRFMEQELCKKVNAYFGEERVEKMRFLISSKVGSIL